MLLTLILTLSHYLTLSHSPTLSISHWITLDMLKNFCFHLYAQKSLSRSHTLTLTHSLSLSLSHSLNLSFNHSRHAEEVLFSCLGSKVAVYSRKLQWFFFDLRTLTCEFWVHRAGSQLKNLLSETIMGFLPWPLSSSLRCKWTLDRLSWDIAKKLELCKTKKSQKKNFQKDAYFSSFLMF